MTSAWLWCAAGEKEWRCVHAQDSDALLATNALSGRAALGGGGGGDGSDDDEEEAPVPDLFRPDLQRFPRLAAARVYAGVQRAGDVCFNPSGCLHAVRNNAFTVSLTHNYVDASNLGAVLADGARSLTSELLPMARALGPKKFLKTLRKSLGGGLKASELEALLRALPRLARDAAVAEAMDAAVRPESGVDAAEARELLAGGARGEAGCGAGGLRRRRENAVRGARTLGRDAFCLSYNHLFHRATTGRDRAAPLRRATTACRSAT